MKIIKESKQEKLPIEFITQFVSKSWDEIGNIKASITGIKKEFSGTKEVEKILQDLADAYLIAIGQLEAHLNKKDYIDLPEDEDKNELKEDINDVLVHETVEEKEQSENNSLSENFNEVLNLTEKVNEIKDELGLDYDILKITTEKWLGSDIYYFKNIQTVRDAEKFNYHSDYWGDAETYQDENIYVIEQLEDYIGKQVIIEEDGKEEVVRLVCMLIDTQYNSLSHTCLLVDKELEEETAEAENVVKIEQDEDVEDVIKNKTTDEDFADMDFPEAVPDAEADNAIREWLNK